MCVCVKEEGGRVADSGRLCSYLSLSNFLPSHPRLPPSLVVLPQQRKLPLHHAAANKAELGVVQALLKAYPAAAEAQDEVCMRIHKHTHIDSYARTFKQVYGMCV